ncbi:hypothetical protein JKP75_17355 [Blastococcus sp. TML/M2B]|uniref:hypothetical protein n=1 Tax=unclassified Blastococcus TaxID=2619396 RepID=UPI0019098D98|nr:MULTISPECIES: hypothetical protein [unclassified Blastococcus]MBN1094166.1 hypothetical protein [Blastococcus sp. TML/M2B]MBN1095716.1 hypothetical protein [Blastococcus sp. TML/C7B]
MPATTTPRARLAAGLLAGGLGLGALAGCTFGSENVSCSPRSCTVTLEGTDAEVNILGTTLRFGGTEGGRASLGVGSASVSCAEGESVSAGSLVLECSSVGEDRVELTASLG